MKTPNDWKTRQEVWKDFGLNILNHNETYRKMKAFQDENPKRNEAFREALFYLESYLFQIWRAFQRHGLSLEYSSLTPKQYYEKQISFVSHDDGIERAGLTLACLHASGREVEPEWLAATPPGSYTPLTNTCVRCGAVEKAKRACPEFVCDECTIKELDENIPPQELRDQLRAIFGLVDSPSETEIDFETRAARKLSEEVQRRFLEDVEDPEIKEWDAIFYNGKDDGEEWVVSKAVTDGFSKARATKPRGHLS